MKCTSSLLTTGQVYTTLANLRHVAVLKDLQVAEQSTDLERLLVALLDVRKVEQDIVADRGVTKPGRLRIR